MGPTWGPSGVDRTQVGPMLTPWTLLSGTCSVHEQNPTRQTRQWFMLSFMYAILNNGWRIVKYLTILTIGIKFYHIQMRVASNQERANRSEWQNLAPTMEAQVISSWQRSLVNARKDSVLKNLLPWAVCGRMNIYHKGVSPISITNDWPVHLFFPDASIGLRVLSLPVSVRPPVTKFVRAITHHPFKLGSPNLDHMCKKNLG